MDPRHAKMIQSRLVPPPQKFSVQDYSVWPIADGAKVRLLCPNTAAADMTETFFRNICHANVAVEQELLSTALPAWAVSAAWV